LQAATASARSMTKAAPTLDAFKSITGISMMAPARLESAAPAPAAQQKHKYQHQLQQDHNHHHNHHHKPALAAKADLFGGLCLWYI